MSKLPAGYYVIARGIREKMTAIGFYNPDGKIVMDRDLAVKFAHLADMLDFVETHRIRLDHNDFIAYSAQGRDVLH